MGASCLGRHELLQERAGCAARCRPAASRPKGRKRARSLRGAAVDELSSHRYEGPLMTTTVRVAHSPDSDDAFMFYGLASGAVKAQGIEFVHELGDIETLNKAAVEGRYEITALSVHAYAYLHDRYLLLDSGASFGDGYGPTVVVPEGSEIRDLGGLTGKRIAIPGKWTSAALALPLRLPLHTPVVMDFKQVGEAAKRGEVDARLEVHDDRRV